MENLKKMCYYCYYCFYKRICAIIKQNKYNINLIMYFAHSYVLIEVEVVEKLMYV